MKTDKRSVAIFGGGIAGLTVAHELVERGHDVVLYEKDSFLGGMAKSVRDLFNGVPSEHSWRAYAHFYDNLYDILGRIVMREGYTSIPMEDVKSHNTPESLWTTYKGRVYDITNFVPHHPGGSIILKAGGRDLEHVWEENGVMFHSDSRLVQKRLKAYEIGILPTTEGFSNSAGVVDNLNHNDIEFVVTSGSRINVMDVPYLLYSHLKAVMSNHTRPDELYSTLKGRVSKGTWDYLAHFLGASGFGFDINTIGMRQYALFLQKTLFRPGWTTMNRPTSEAWIEPWLKYLQSLGLRVHLNSELYHINTMAEQVVSCQVKRNGRLVTMEADEYFFCVNPNLSHPIFERSGMDLLATQFRDLSVVNNQIGFVIGFHTEVTPPKKGFSLNDSLYGIMLYPQDQFWLKNVDLGYGVQSLWSGTIVTPYRKGMSGKSATDMTRSELEREIFNQVFTDKYFAPYRNSVEFVRIYDEWKYTNGRLTTPNPKWVNTLTNESYRPSQKTSYTNFYLAGAHTRTSVDIWCMEGAVESGKLACQAMLGDGVDVYDHNILSLNILRQIDGWLYRVGLPNIMDVILLSVLVSFITRKK